MGGLTILEIAIYVALLVVRGRAPDVCRPDLYESHHRERHVQPRCGAQPGLFSFASSGEVRRSITGNIVITNNGKTMSMTPATAFDGAGPVPGAPITFDMRVTSAEQVNGADDNNNGLIDEGEVVRTDTATGEQSVIAGGVDLVNSGFAMNGDGVATTISSFGSGGQRAGSVFGNEK